MALLSGTLNKKIGEFKLIQLKREFREKSNSKGISLFLLDLILLSVSIYGTLVLDSTFLRFVCSVFAGLFMSFLFLVGHDAIHGSLTRIPWLNRMLGTIAFLPVLHPYKLWILVHHRHHHGYTNLSGNDYDYVWSPYSKKDFDELPQYRKFLEKFYRSPFGHGFYYMIEIWWKRLFFPKSDYIKGGYTKSYVWDMVILAVFIMLQVSGIVYLTETGVISQPWWSTIIFTYIVPHVLICNWFLGVVLLLQHNHPDIPWYNNIDEWKKESKDTGDTAHFVLPKLINLVAHGVDEHNGHHLSVNIPLYNLGKVQKYLDEEYLETIPSYKLTPSAYLRILNHCQLYDYEKHQWLIFNGNISQPILLK